MIKEIWKVHPDLDGKYEVSSTGRIRTIPWKMRLPGEVGRERKQSTARSGYLVFCFRSSGKIITRLSHRLVADLFVPGHFEGAQVNHKDGNKKNNMASNLEWVTGSENVKHSYDILGRTRSPKKLTAEMVIEIRKRILSGESRSKVSKEFGVHPTGVHKIIHRQTWSWL